MAGRYQVRNDTNSRKPALNFEGSLHDINQNTFRRGEALFRHFRSYDLRLCVVNSHSVYLFQLS